MQDKYSKEIKAKLNSKDEKIVFNTLKDIRVTGKAEITPLILNLLDQNKSPKINEEIISILGQLKDKACVPFIVEAIETDAVQVLRKELITTCWQSGLDYSKHITLFAKEFIKGDYTTAIEAFTVIEEWIFESEQNNIKDCKEYLINSVSDVDQDKKPLYIELVKLVESYQA